MRGRFLRLVLCLSALPAGAQMLVPVGVDLFGDGIVKALPASGVRSIKAHDSGGPIIPGYAHTLLFQDGRQLRGSLVELTSDQVLWSRPDAEPPFRFARSEIRRISFSNQPFTPIPEQFPQIKPRRPEKDVPATVKLPGGDWLFGDVRAENGEDFSVTLKEGATLKFSRASVEWVYFGRHSAPAFGFSGESLGMEGWTLGTPSAPVEVVGGWFKLPQNVWIGRDISPPDRFEIDFEVPEGVHGTRLWLQPMRPSPNTYSTGTIELSFSQRELTRLIFFNQFAREKSDMPQEKHPSGRIRYRVFYDLPGNRLVVMRNDTLVGEWKLHDEAKVGADMVGGRQMGRLPRGICFDRPNSTTPLSLGRLRMQPWDGVIPQPGAALKSRMTASGGTPKAGKLDAIGASEIVFNGEKTERADETFIHLAQSPGALRGGDALVSFGNRGELAAAGLEIREGRARARTAAIAEVDLPVEVVQGIVFPQRKAEAREGTDVLVFRNGDSLAGQLVAAGSGEPVQWRVVNGQELTFKPEHVAGARLGASQPRETPAAATAELGSGDRIRGDMLALNGTELRLRHESLGERSLDRRLLRTLYPGKRALVLDAGSDPEAWLGLANRGHAGLLNARPRAESNYGRVFLDGVFLTPPPQGSSWNSTGMTRVVDKLERYELRCEVTDAGGAEPYLNGSISGNNGTPSLQVTVGHGQLRVYSYNIGGGRGRAFQQEREVTLADKLPEKLSRRELRFFIDTKVGTVDFMIDGVHIMRFGQQAKERAPGLGAQVSLSAYSMGGNVSLLSNIWLGPWNGDVPRAGELTQGVALNNGDIAAGVIGELKDGKIPIGEGPDAIEVPLERITAFEFGALQSPERPVARIRMNDGTVLNLADYRWADGNLRGNSASLGKIDVPAKVVTELIFAPAPARFPQLALVKKLANQSKDEATDAQP